METIRAESRLTFWEATGILIGHGVGAGILAVPFYASRNTVGEIFLIVGFSFLFNVILHLLIAELSLNNGGAQFVACFDRELFSGKLKKLFTWLSFVLLGLSIIVNVSAFLTGAADVFVSWFELPRLAGALIFYVIGAGVVFVGMKLIGICEKYAVISMSAVTVLLFIATLIQDFTPVRTLSTGSDSALALFGMVSFSLSAVMSTPQVVKGLNGDIRRIRRSVITALAVNCTLILLVTFSTILSVGDRLTGKAALVDLADHLGSWVSIVGYVFTLMALATSFWSNTLNLRDIVSEQTHWRRNSSWFAATVPCLAVACFCIVSGASFSALSRFASVVQVVTGLGIIIAYQLSRRRVGSSPLLGKFGSLPVCVLVACCSVLATVGAVIPVE